MSTRKGGGETGERKVTVPKDKPTARKAKSYARWVGLTSGESIVDAIRAVGMTIILCWKGGMCFYTQVAVNGTAKQMAELDQRWKQSGRSVKKKEPSGAWPITLDIPESQWADNKNGRAR